MNPFSETNNVSELDEKSLIKRVCVAFDEVMPSSPYGAGDDCAVVPQVPSDTLATVDSVIMDRHFTRNTPPELAAQKLINRNVSDIASMGGTPLYALTSAVFSGNLSLDWLDRFSRGLADAAKKYGIKLVGGDMARVGGEFFSMHLTLIGKSPQTPLLRMGAKVGDAIYITGPLGISFDSEHHLNFSPRLEEGKWLASISGVSACTDVSDGVASDLKNILPRDCYAEINKDALPLRAFNGRVATVNEALCDGEDYELLFCFDGDCAIFEAEYFAKFAKQLFRIGTIKKANSSEDENAIVLVSSDSRNIFRESGFSHTAS